MGVTNLVQQGNLLPVSVTRLYQRSEYYLSESPLPSSNHGKDCRCHCRLRAPFSRCAAKQAVASDEGSVGREDMLIEAISAKSKSHLEVIQRSFLPEHKVVSMVTCVGRATTLLTTYLNDRYKNTVKTAPMSRTMLVLRKGIPCSSPLSRRSVSCRQYSAEAASSRLSFASLSNSASCNSCRRRYFSSFGGGVGGAPGSQGVWPGDGRLSLPISLRRRFATLALRLSFFAVAVPATPPPSSSPAPTPFMIPRNVASGSERKFSQL